MGDQMVDRPGPRENLLGQVHLAPFERAAHHIEQPPCLGQPYVRLSTILEFLFCVGVRRE